MRLNFFVLAILFGLICAEVIGHVNHGGLRKRQSGKIIWIRIIFLPLIEHKN